MFPAARLLFGIGFILFATSATAEPARLALLIGNEGYSKDVGTLTNPVKDIHLIGESLQKLGFQITTLQNLDYRGMDVALKKYAINLRKAGKGAIGFFYYSGHGAADPETRTNYLIPVDVSRADDDRLWLESFSQSNVIDLLSKEAREAYNFVVFDACRDELRLPHSNKSLGSEKGFLPVEERGGIFISYATAVGESASDAGTGGGPYARALARELLVPGVEAFTMFRNVQLRVLDETGGKQEPWMSASTLPAIYFSKPDARRAMPATFVPPPLQKVIALPPPLFVQLELANADYIPDLRSTFGWRNNVALSFENDGRPYSTVIKGGEPSSSLPMKYNPADQLIAQIVELGFSTNEITDHQVVPMAELGKPARLTFRIKDSTFKANSNLDPEKKTISLTVDAVAFDPEKSSGADSEEQGALALSADKPVLDSISFAEGDATDYIKLASGKGKCVVQMGALGGSSTQNVDVEMSAKGKETEFAAMQALEEPNLWGAPCDDASGTTFRITAQPVDGGGAYRVSVIDDVTRTADFLRLVDATITESDSMAPQDTTDATIRSISALRRFAEVDDAPAMIKEFEQIVSKPSNDAARFSSLVAQIVDSEPDFYRAADQSPVLKIPLALYRAEAGKPFDREAILAALQSSDEYVAGRAVHIVGQMEDHAFVRTTLTPLLLDKRDEVARNARDELLKIDAKPGPGSP